VVVGIPSGNQTLSGDLKGHVNGEKIINLKKDFPANHALMTLGVIHGESWLAKAYLFSK